MVQILEKVASIRFYWAGILQEGMVGRLLLRSGFDNAPTTLYTAPTTLQPPHPHQGSSF